MFSRPQAWVKNVYSLCVEGVVNSAQSYTVSTTSTQSPIDIRVQPQVIPLFLNSFTPYSYTAIFTRLHLLFTHLYTVSTAPIIKKNKKK